MLNRREIVSLICRLTQVRPSLGELLYELGVESEEACRLALNPYYERIPVPTTLPGVEAAAKAILKATGGGEPVAVWGDGDTDGVTAAAIVLSLITELGGEGRPYILKTDRVGHGLNADGLERLARDGVKLVVTVDCGGSDGELARYGEELGMTVVVTDHHEITGELPPLLVNPKTGGESYRFLSGAGVAFKVAWHALSLSRGLGLLDIARRHPQLVVLAAVGTVADRMPLIGENRAIVDKGRELLERTSNVWVSALRNAAGGLSLEKVVSVLSSGRPEEGGGHEALSLLVTEDSESAAALAREMYGRSEEWRKSLDELYERVRSSVRRVRGYLLLDLRAEERQFLGPLAGRLKESLRVPVIVLGEAPDGTVIGEVRSPRGVDSLRLLSSFVRLFKSYGGHKGSAGFRMEPSQVAELAEELETVCGGVNHAEPEPDVSFDMEDDAVGLGEVVRLGRLGVEIRVGITGRASAILKRFAEESVSDPKRLLSHYPPQSRVYVEGVTGVWGFRPISVSESE